MINPEQPPKHPAKTSSRRTGIFATLRALLRAQGTGAPTRRSSGRLRATLTALALAIAAFALTAAPASAAPPTTTTPVITGASYATAHVEGEVTSDGSGIAGTTTFTFQYSTDEITWSPGFSETLVFAGAFTDRLVEGSISVPKGGTKYFVRLFANNGFAGPENEADPENEAHSPGPNPDFTTLPVDPPTLPGPVAASPVFSTSATATGKVKRPTSNPDPAFNITKCRFEYVTDADFTATGFAAATPVPCEQPLPFEAPEGETDVTAKLPGLNPSTTYHLRLAAENAAPGTVTKEAAATFTTEPKVAKPTVIATDDATDVTAHGAKFSGEVQRPAGADPALDIECRFEFVTDAQFTATGFEGAGSTPCAENPITAATVNGEGKQEVHSEFGGFNPAITYHLRLAAKNEGGSDAKDAASTFTTEPAELPTVTIDPVAGGTYTTAHVSGTVDIDDPGHHEAYASIEVSADGGVTWDGVSIPNPGHSGINVVERNVTGLQPNSTYTFRIKSTYSGGFPPEVEANGEMAFSPEPNPSITTEELFAPTATINPVNPVTATTAHFSGTVDPHAPGGTLSELGKKAFATQWHFECTPGCKDANGNVLGGTVQGEEGNQPVAVVAKGLEPNTHYEVTLVVSSEGGSETVGPVPFDTPLVKPTVRPAPGSSDSKGGYTLQGVVNPNNSEVTDCEFEWGPNAPNYAFSAPCSPAPGDKAQPVTVEAHLIGLTPGATYHAKLVATNGAGTEDGGDQTFVPTLTSTESCSNEQLRIENNSLALPECRAYEQVSPSSKVGLAAELIDYTDNGSVAYQSGSGNIANSGRGELRNFYVTDRSSVGWKTVPNLNGPTGSPYSGPEPPFNETSVPFRGFSADLRSSLWLLNPGHKQTDRPYLRNPDGEFTAIGNTLGGNTFNTIDVGNSDDLTHVVFNGRQDVGGGMDPAVYGPGVYEFVGTGNDLPRRVDVNNLGHAVSECGNPNTVVAKGDAVSGDGNVIVVTVNGTGGSCANAHLDEGPGVQGELWARVAGTTSYDVSASLCSRTGSDPCNAAAAATFQGAASDGSRVYFTTTQQLVNGDTDDSNDLYVCDIPTGPQVPAGIANSCSSLSQVSGAAAEADVESVAAVSEDGSTVYFVAAGVLAPNPGALGEAAAPDDHNLYVWRRDAAHPAGQTTFVARLSVNDLGNQQAPQTTPDGDFLAFSTTNQLALADTDNVRDAYRYDANTGAIVRLSTNVFGVGGNSDNFDVGAFTGSGHHLHSAMSDDGEAIVFVTNEALSPLDGNGEQDVYLWKAGRVSLISTGSVGGGATRPAISGSGRDIYFNTGQQLTPSDGDDAGDVYDARSDGGFSSAQVASCLGEICQPPPPGPPPATAPVTGQPPVEPGNVKLCPKGKVPKGKKCVKKSHKKHTGKTRHGKKVSHKQGGGK